MRFRSMMLCLAASACLTAETLTIVPAAPTVLVGSTVTINVLASGLPAGTAPSLAAFQMDFTYDTGLLSLISVSFGNQLSLFGVPSIQGFIPGVGSGVTVFESSFNSQAELESAQAASFTLFQLQFAGSAPGVSSLNLANVLMVDAASPAPNDITGSFVLSGSSVQVLAPSAIPEPGPSSLFAAGAALLFVLRQRGRHR